MQHHDPIDELVRRAHGQTPGAPAGFIGRVSAQAMAERVARRRARVIYIQTAVAVAAVLILALTIGLNPQWFTPAQVEPEPQPQAKSYTGTPDPKTPQPKPEPQPEPRVNAPEPEPEPGPQPEPQPEPEQPEPQPEQPTPEPEQPAPEPEKPKPEPVKPDDVVEKPEPKQPEDTTPAPKTEREVLATVLGTDTKLSLYHEGLGWRDWDGTAAINAGLLLKAPRDPVDLQLAIGGLARFNGEMRGDFEADILVFTLATDTLYLDTLGIGRVVTVKTDEHRASMTDGAGLFYRVANGMEVACLHGTITLDGETVEAGTVRRATARGVGDAKAYKGDSLLRDLPARVLLREDFDKAPEGGMYEEGERLENGLAVCDRQPGYIAFRYNPTFTVLPGTVLRVRLRATDVSRLELELFTLPDLKLLKRNKEIMFKHTWNPGGDEWQTVEFVLADMTEKDNPERKIEPGELLRNFKLHFTGKKLEIDWVEFVRVQE